MAHKAYDGAAFLNLPGTRPSFIGVRMEGTSLSCDLTGGLVLFFCSVKEILKNGSS